MPTDPPPERHRARSSDAARVPPVRTSDLRNILLWAARWLIPGGGFYEGKRLKVTIEYGGRSAVIERPDGMVSGLTPPPQIQVGGAAGPTASDLVRHFLGDRERAVLKALVDLGPCRAGDLEEAVAAVLKRSEFYTIWGNLQVRGLVVEGEGGYDFAHPWVKALVAPPERSAA